MEEEREMEEKINYCRGLMVFYNLKDCKWRLVYRGKVLDYIPPCDTKEEAFKHASDICDAWQMGVG